MAYLGQYLGQDLGQGLGLDFSSHDVIARFADMDFTCADARYLSYAQLTEKFAGGVPAIRTIGGKKFLQVESAAESLLPYHDKFDEANWVPNELTLADAAVTTPHTDLDGWSLTPTAVSGPHYLRDNYTVDGASQYASSAIVKSNGYDWAQLFLWTAGFVGTPFAFFNLSTGVVGNSDGVDTVGIEPLGDGWYLIYMSALSDAVALGLPQISPVNTDTNSHVIPNWSGDTTSGILCCHTQFETGFYPSSIIETAAAAVTRAKTEASWASANVPSALRRKFTVDIIPYWDYDAAPNANPFICEFEADGASHNIDVYYVAATEAFRVRNQTAPWTFTSNAVTFSRNQKLTLTLDPAGGNITVAGASSGDGTKVGTVWSTSSGNVWWGSNAAAESQICGLISEPY